MKKIRVAVIGCGVISPLHIDCFQSNEQSEVVCVCDIDHEKARSTAEKFSVPKFVTDVNEIFSDNNIDAVSICTDHASHTEIALSSLKHGKHTLCEKPLAANYTDLRKLVRAEHKYNDKVFAAVFQHRFDPIYQTLTTLVEEKYFGKILTLGTSLRCHRTDEYYTSSAWRGTWKYEGGSVLINQAIHYIDLLIMIGGGVEKIVSAVCENINHKNIIETEDTASAILKLKCGSIGIIEATNASNIDWEAKITINGTRGSVEIINENISKISFSEKSVEDEVKARLESLTSPPIHDNAKPYYGSGHTAQISNFINAINTGAKPLVTVSSAAETVKTIFEIYKKANCV